jgi:primase-polymerase (primpol)-like protein
VGFLFSTGDPFTDVDLDGCLDAWTGDVAVWAKEIVMSFPTYYAA